MHCYTVSLWCILWFQWILTAPSMSARANPSRLFHRCSKPMRSRPIAAMGMEKAWIGVGFSKPRSFSTISRSNFGDKFLDLYNPPALQIPSHQLKITYIFFKVWESLFFLQNTFVCHLCAVVFLGGACKKPFRKDLEPAKLTRNPSSKAWWFLKSHYQW